MTQYPFPKFFPVKNLTKEKAGNQSTGLQTLRMNRLISDEQFNVLLRTIATSHRPSNGSHGGTSISWSSPPLFLF